jgi:hypothetical protein
VIQNTQANLFHVVAALRATSGFAGSLNRWQQQRHENAYDRNNHQQLDQRKAAPTHGCDLPSRFSTHYDGSCDGLPNAMFTLCVNMFRTVALRGAQHAERLNGRSSDAGVTPID